jgi:hypothetical protein
MMECTEKEQQQSKEKWKGASMGGGDNNSNSLRGVPTGRNANKEAAAGAVQGGRGRRGEETERQQQQKGVGTERGAAMRSGKGKRWVCMVLCGHVNQHPIHILQRPVLPCRFMLLLSPLPPRVTCVRCCGSSTPPATTLLLLTGAAWCATLTGV